MNLSFPGTGPDDSDIESVGHVRAPEDAKVDSDASRKEALLRLARDRFSVCVDAEQELRHEQLRDKRFRAGQQWDEQAIADRRRDRLPALTVNRIPQFINQITGAQRVNRPSIQISAVDDFGDPETAEVLQGIVKHIEAISHADVAYDTAVDDQATMGRGYFRIITAYADEDSFDLEIKIQRIRNAHYVYYDPRCQEPDYSDALYAFVVADYSLEEFKATFPDVDEREVSGDAFEDLGDKKSLWYLQNNAIRVAEYFYVEHEEGEIAKLSDGRSLPLEEAHRAVATSLAEAQKGVSLAEQGLIALDQIPPMLEIVKTRRAKRRVVKWAKLNGTRVLEEGTWPGKWIPIIPVLGDEIDLDGKVDYRGIVRDLRDQQRVFNYQVSELVATMQMASKSPWVIAAGQLEGFENLWKTANLKRWAYLPYKAIAAGGVAVPPPQRNTFEPAIQAILQAIELFDNQMKAVTGFYDASLGERGPEQSGKAILARQKQGEIGSIHYVDNLGRALWALGRQLIDLIPKIYDAPRVMRITGADEKARAVMVHAGNADAIPSTLPKGVQSVYDLSVGRYDVVVTTGPSHSTQRQETVEMMTQAIQANPDLLKIIGDLYFGAMDWPKARQIAERLKKFLPPQAHDDDDPENPDVLRAIATKLQEELELAQAMIQEQAEELRVQRIQTDAKKEIAILQTKADVAMKMADLAVKQQGTADQIAAGDRKQARDLAARADEAARARQAQREQAQFTRQGEVADTVLQAELSQLDRQQDEAAARQAREEQRADAREARAFEAEQAATQAAQAGARPPQGKAPR